MDGNGRWATARGWPRAAGHRAGAAAVRRTVEAAPAHGIELLTLYAFSSDNWRRPPSEVEALLGLIRRTLRSQGERCEARGVRMSVIGRRDRLPRALVDEIEAVEERTRGGPALHVQVAVDYSSRDAVVEALRRAVQRGDALHSGQVLGPEGSGGRAAVRTLLSQAVHAPAPLPDLDLVIRTGGEQRLSDFLLWEAAYAELFFDPRPWPEYDGDRLEAAMRWFAGRVRRFGGASPGAIPGPGPTTDLRTVTRRAGSPAKPTTPLASGR
jgi:undecaprenyl diphosphate synthase